MIDILENPPTINTKRLTIRPLTMADDEAIYDMKMYSIIRDEWKPIK